MFVYLFFLKKENEKEVGTWHLGMRKGEKEGGKKGGKEREREIERGFFREVEYCRCRISFLSFLFSANHRLATHSLAVS